MIPNLDEVIKRAKLHPSRVFNVYIFGSRVYKTCSDKSDWDFIIVANNSVESTEIRSGDFNIHVYTPSKFQEDLDWHRINNLECVFAPDWAKLKEDIKYNVKIDLPKLRHAISHISSNSFVKSKKKLAQNDYYTGIKSIFHSIRIPMFGLQIANFGKIVDFSEANYIWDDITFKSLPQYMRDKKEWTWDELDKKWRPTLNSVLSQFRKSAAKD